MTNRHKKLMSEQPKLWCDMTDAEKGALLLAHHNGKVIELAGIYDDTKEFEPWTRCPLDFLWRDEAFAYRVKPEPVKTTATFKAVLSYWERQKSFYMSENNHSGDNWTQGTVTIEAIDGKPVYATWKADQ